MFFNPLYKKFTIIGLSIILVFIISSYNNEVHAQKLNLKQKIASIKWPSILQGKRISLDDSLKQEPQPKVKKTKLQSPAKQPKVKKLKPEPQPKVQAKPKKQPKLKPQVSPTSNRIQIKLPKIGPLFKKQIASGGPVTVTHPEMTRYFMTIPEACQLVLEAGCMGKGGEIYVFDMGKSIKILDLAKSMIRLSGLELEKDIQITFTGLRPGEKLFEELLNPSETSLPTHHKKIMIATVREYNFEKIKSLNPSPVLSPMKCVIPYRKYMGLYIC